MKPDFSFFKERILINQKTNESYRFVPIASIDPTPEQLDSIVEACSSPDIYKWLFAKLFPDGYTLQNAIGFVNWAKAGWKDNNLFVFLMLSSENKIVGAIDIRGSDLSAAEVGYWIYHKHSGLASVALTVIKEIAKQAGYQKLFSQTKMGNVRSERVLKNNSFKRDLQFLKNPDCDNAFVVELKS